MAAPSQSATPETRAQLNPHCQAVIDARGVATLTICNAGPLIIFNSTVIDAVRSGLEALAKNDRIRVLIIRGDSERAFVGGADIKEMVDLNQASAEAMITRLRDACEAVRQFPAPVIARIPGWVLGGGLEFAACCDFRVASDNSHYGMPEVRVGIPSVIHAALLPRLIGSSRTRWLLMTAENIDAATALGRKVALVGRSMRKNVNIGRSLGHIELPEGMLIQPQEVEDWPEHKVVVISTGSQGEPLSALRRMAHNDHRLIKLHEGDTVVFSATPIPGNERAVNETVDRLYHIGCNVITPRDAPIHASGHGYVEELKLMLNLVKPRYVLPVHGDYKRIQLHAELADAVGIDPDDVFRGENGLPLEIDGSRARFGEPEQSGMIFVDGVDVGDPADVALRDRRMLSADGIFIVVATVSEQSGESVAQPEVIFRGVPFMDQADQLLEEIRATVEASLRRAANEEIREVDLLQQALHDDLAQLVYDRLKRRPMVLPVVVEV